MIDRFYIYYINNSLRELETEFGINVDDITVLKIIIEKLEFNYSTDMAKTMDKASVEMIKTVLYTIKELYFSDYRNKLDSVKRKELIEVYNNCKQYERRQKDTEQEIKCFSDYYTKSLIYRFNK